MKFFKNLPNLLGLFANKHSSLFGIISAFSFTGAILFPLSILFKKNSIFENVSSSTLILFTVVSIVLSIILIIGFNKSKPNKNPLILFRNKLKEAVNDTEFLYNVRSNNAEGPFLLALRKKAICAKTIDEVDKLLETTENLKKIYELKKELRYLENEKKRIEKLPKLIEEKEKEIREAEAESNKS